MFNFDNECHSITWSVEGQVGCKACCSAARDLKIVFRRHWGPRTAVDLGIRPEWQVHKISAVQLGLELFVAPLKFLPVHS